jgi:hypothetical protein
MTTPLTSNAFSARCPRLGKLMGDQNVAERLEELEWFGAEW